MPPFLQLLFPFPKLLKELLVMFIAQEEMYSCKFVSRPWKCCKLKTLWLVPAILQTSSSLVSPHCKASRAAQASPAQVTDFVCSHGRDCSHLRALDTSREKGHPWVWLPKRHFPAKSSRSCCLYCQERL